MVAEPHTLARLETATRLLAEAKTVDEVRDIRNLAEMARVYARERGLGLAAMNHAAEIKIRAERRLGELLREMPKQDGGDAARARSHAVTEDELPPTLEDLGIERMQSHRWQQVAAVPAPVLERHIAETRANDQELTTAGVMRLAREVERETVHANRPKVAPPTGKYRILYADPPWDYSDSGLQQYGHASHHYPTMTIAELCALPIKDLAEDNAVLFLWVTSPFLDECFAVVSAWGFSYKTSFVWDKVAHNFGHYNSVRHEFLLVCTRGSCTPDATTLHDSVQTIERSGKHSEKPEAFRTIIDGLYTHGDRIELFAREAHPNWARWGNE